MSTLRIQMDRWLLSSFSERQAQSQEAPQSLPDSAEIGAEEPLIDLEVPHENQHQSNPLGEC